MAIQIIERGPGFGGLLGQAIGQGLAGFGTGYGQGLTRLAEMKLQDLQQKQAATRLGKSFENLQGFTPEQAQRAAAFFSGLPPEAQKGIFSSPEAFGNILNILQGPEQTGEMTPAMAQSPVMQPTMHPSLAQRLSPLEQIQQDRAMQLLGIKPEMLAQAQAQQLPLVASQPEAATQQSQMIQPTQPKRIDYRELLKSPETRRREEELELRRKKDIREERKATAEETKATREFSKPYVERADAAEKNIRDYKTLANLSYKGDIRSGSFRGILDKLKMPWLYRNYTTELADKTIARLAQNASSAFGTGSRITNYLEQTFQRSLPSLWNTPEMIKTISEINMLADKGNVIVNNERSKLLKETGGIVPGNADDIIRERARPLLNRLEERALLIASNPVIKTPNPYELDAQGKQLYPDGSIIEIEGRVFEKEGRKWKPVYDDEFFFI